MQFIDIRRIKVVLVLSAIVIAVASLYISHQLVRDLSMEERLRMEVWAEACVLLIQLMKRLTLIWC